MMHEMVEINTQVPEEHEFQWTGAECTQIVLTLNYWLSNIWVHLHYLK